MRKSLMIVLLTIVSSIKCTSMAQEVNNDDKQKIVDYINCFYTAKYVLSDSAKTTEAEKQVIKEKGIDTVSIGHAYKYAALDSILKNNNLMVTADNLTKKLNERNREITYNGNVFDFIDDAVDTAGFENFKFTRKDECDVRNTILAWYREKDRDIRQEKDESENKDETQPQKENKELPNWGWIPLAIIFLYILGKIIMAMKGRGYDDTEEPRSYYSLDSQNSMYEVLRTENDKLKAEIIKLKEDLREKRDKREEEIVIKTQNEINNEVRSEIETYLQKDIEKATISTAAIVYYADIDVSNNIFVRTYKEETRISVYAINVSQQTFAPIENKQLYEKLSMVNSSGILDACEVKNNYQNGKAVSITPGKVQQEENGKWRIINKAIIEVK